MLLMVNGTPTHAVLRLAGKPLCSGIRHPLYPSYLSQVCLWPRDWPDAQQALASKMKEGGFWTQLWLSMHSGPLHGAAGIFYFYMDQHTFIADPLPVFHLGLYIATPHGFRTFSALFCLSSQFGLQSTCPPLL